MIYLRNDDCFTALKELNDDLVDMVFVDLPYGTTACKWDTVIDLEKMWSELDRITKDNAPMLFTASQPFTSRLVSSNYDWFRYEWIYQKIAGSNFAQAKYQPMKEHESVLIFSKKPRPIYFPIKEERRGTGSDRAKYKYTDKSRKQVGQFMGQSINESEFDYSNDSGNDKLRYPSSVQIFNNRAKGDRGLHPTQKPVAMVEYFIKTYTRENETVLDFTMGSGTTGVACKNLNRGFIGIEQDRDIFEIAYNRISTDQ